MVLQFQSQAFHYFKNARILIASLVLSAGLSVPIPLILKCIVLFGKPSISQFAFPNFVMQYMLLASTHLPPLGMHPLVGLFTYKISFQLWSSC